MTFARVNPIGFIDNISPITANQINQIDINQSRAIDGTNGGTYATSAPLVFQGTNGIVYQCTGAAANIALGSRQIKRQQNLSGFSNVPGFWKIDGDYLWENNAPNPFVHLHLHLDLPHGQVLDSVTVRYKATAGHMFDPVDQAGGIDVAMPSVTVQTIGSSGEVVVLGTQVDTVTARALYEAYHDITISGLAHTIDRENLRYNAIIRAEQGTDYLSGTTRVSQMYALITCTNYVEY